MIKKIAKTEKVNISQKTTEKKTKHSASYYEGVGRRKEASCRIRLYVEVSNDFTLGGKTIKKGEIIVNGKSIEQYFPTEVYKKLYLEPYRTTNTIGRFTISAIITGGGIVSQLNAFLLASSRALEKVDREKFRSILKKKGFLTRDSRTKQRRKAGYAQKSRARKQSPKR